MHSTANLDKKAPEDGMSLDEYFGASLDEYFGALKDDPLLDKLGA